MLELEEKRRELTQRLVESKNEYSKEMIDVLELKFGSHQQNEAELIRLAEKYDQLKATYVKGLIVESIFKRASHVEKGVKEMEGFLDAELAKK